MARTRNDGAVAPHLEIPAFLRRPAGEIPPPVPHDLPSNRELVNREIGLGDAARRLDPATKEFLDQQAAEKRVRAKNRIAKMLVKKEDHRNDRWNSRTCRWGPKNPKPKTGATMPIEIATRTYARSSEATRAACRYLGRDAQPGIDFETKTTEDGRIALTLKTGKNGITTKIAKGPTEIERSYGHLIGRSRKRVRIAATTERPAEAKAAAPKPKKTKPTKVKKVGKRPPKRKETPVSKPKATGGGKSKVAAIAALLTRPEGTTTAEILKATGWPSVSVPQQAKAAGLKLRKEKEKGSPTRYFAS